MSYIGYRLGLTTELVKLTGLVFGFLAGFKYYQGAGDWVAQHVRLPIEWASAIMLVLIVLGVYILVTKGLAAVQKFVQVTFEKRVNQIGGLAAGILRAALISSVLLVVCQQLPSVYLHESIDQHSLSGPTLSRVAPKVYDTLNLLPGRLLAQMGSR